MNDRLAEDLKRKVNLALHDLYQSRTAGPRFRIVHRRPHPNGIYCTAGEQVVAAYLVCSNRSIWLKLPLSQLLLFDNLSRHLHLPRTAPQIALSLCTDEFYAAHGKGVFGRAMTRRFTPTCIKEYVKRLRRAVGIALSDANEHLDPLSVIVSESTVSNQAAYVLRGTVAVEHVL